MQRSLVGITALVFVLIALLLTVSKASAHVHKPFSHMPGSSTQPLPGGSLDPTTIPKYVERLTVLPVMPRTSVLSGGIDYYEIAARQFTQQVLPTGMPQTTVWGYGSVNHPNTFSYPALTIEARLNRPVRVKWINDLKHTRGRFRPHLLPVDQTLHWANPPQDCIAGVMQTDCSGKSQEPYRGPVPLVTHLHGAHVTPESDGHPEAWYLPAANDIPAGYATKGSHFGQIASANVEPGAAVFEYRNDQRATTLWYHDHTLGMTRANVYTGLAGFYLLRGGWSDLSQLPQPAPTAGDPPRKKYFEIALVIQDRSFNSDGSLFYAPHRAFFEGLKPRQLRIPFIPDAVVYADGTTFSQSDVSRLWNPEFFGNTMVVNGKTWPFLDVEPRRYRFRILNASDTRVLILTFPRHVPGGPLTFWQIGNEGGFMPSPVQQSQLVIAPAERADVLVDFSNVPIGTHITLLNIGPDEPFGGGVPGVDFPPADPDTTGQAMQFRVVRLSGPDRSAPPQSLRLPPIPPLRPATNVRQVTLNEFDSQMVLVQTHARGNVVLAPAFDPTNPDFFFFEPVMSQLGTLHTDGTSNALPWMAPITENPALEATEIWELYNFTADAHPIHVHQVAFEVVNRQSLAVGADGIATQPAQLMPGTELPPDPWETGRKDTVLVYPGKVTRIQAYFDIPGLYVWHCHILSHEDNEMMRPFCVGPLGNCQ